MLKLLINNGDGLGDVDYTHFLVPASVDIEDSINTPTLFSFTLSNVDGTFKAPISMAYVKFYSTTSPLSVTGAYLATGYVTNNPEWKFLGMSQRASGQKFQHYELDIKVTSDEYLLNIKSVPFIAAYINQTMGQILSSLSNVLAAGFFDTTNVQNGDLVPYFSYDPSSKWADVAKQFGDQAQYRYKVIGKKIYFAPYGDAPLGISYDEVNQTQKQFVPGALKTGILAVPLINDCIVVGDVEPQQTRDDYFVGDGFTGNFPLKYTLFHGDTSLLLQDDWTEQSFNTSQWTVKDPFGQLVLAGALNVIAGPSSSGGLGQTYTLLNNGLELGGHLVVQHGEFQFNDVSIGILGGIYANSGNLSAPFCVAGFDVRTASGHTIVPTASGANGIQISPMVSGALVGTPVVTVQNHHYILQTSIAAKRVYRYQQVYRTLAGTPFGDAYLPSQAEVTFTITDIDLAQAYNIATMNNPFVPQYIPTITRYTSSGPLPSFGAYVLLNSQQLNLTVNYTMLWKPPQALLRVASLSGATVLNPLALTGGQLPPFDPDDPLAMPEGVAITPYANYPMGFGLDQDITATCNKVGDTDQLQFYQNRIPGVGARIWMTAWQAGHAVSRIQDPVSIAQQSTLVGDNGLRTAIITDMKPTPRSSDETDLAGQAQIVDRETVQYDGDYTVESHFADPTQDYPRSGRKLNVTSPMRGISGAQFLVRQVRISVLELFQEILKYEISFGQDLYLDKLLRRFLPTSPTGILDPSETANQPDPQNLPAPGTPFTTYLDNLFNARLKFINGTQVIVDLGAPPVTGVEVRRSDTGWGTNSQNLIQTFTGQIFTLPRSQIDQVWYMRMVNGPKKSRFTRAFRVNYPLVPTPPSMTTVIPGSSLGGQQLTRPQLIVSLPTLFDKNIYGLQIDRGPHLFPGGSSVTVVSDSPTDNRVCSAEGEDSTGAVFISFATLNGTTPVTFPGTFYAIFSVEVET